jgi:uncharacterized protein DUF6983
MPTSIASPPALQLIPLVAQNQRLSVQLAGTTYNLETRWNIQANCWVLWISDVDSNPLAGPIALVSGADLLEQFEYLDIGGSLFVYDSAGPPGTNPTFTSLGVTSNLYFQQAA